MDNRLLLNVEEVSQLTGLAKGTIYHWISQKRIPVVRLSPRCVRFRRCDLEAWLAGLAEGPSAGSGKLGHAKKFSARLTSQVPRARSQKGP